MHGVVLLLVMAVATVTATRPSPITGTATHTATGSATRGGTWLSSTATYTATATIPASTFTADTVAPPTALTATTTNASATDSTATIASAHLAWNRSTSPFVQGYQVRRAASVTGPWTVIASPVGADTTTFTDTLPLSGTSYYTVEAVAGNWTSPASNAVAVGAPLPQVVTAPTALKVAITAADTVLTWTRSVTTGVDTQLIYTSQRASGPFTLTATVPGAATTWVDSSWAYRSMYYYVVARAGSVVSPPSNTVSVRGRD